MVDLSDRLTVFVITVGEETTQACLDALREQDVGFRLKIIDHVAPMEAAFQQMLDTCETPYFVQVDADMVLYPHAIRTLYRAIIDEPNDMMMVNYPLHDVHLDRAIVGVKIYRHDIAKQFPYQSDFSCEMGQLQKAETAGYRYRSHFKHMLDFSLCLGEHGTHFTPRSIFERYRNLMQRYRLYPFMGWLRPWPQEFLRRYQEDPTDLNLYALLGAIVGLTSDLSQCKQDKDYREYDKMEDFKALRTHLVGGGPQDLNLYVTTKCNFKCWFCRRQQDKVEDMPDMIPAMVERTLRKFPTIKNVCIAGFGEPLMHPRLDELVGVLNSHGIKPSIITNGVLLAKRIDDLAKMDLSFISVSLNESNAEAHERTHGVKMFDRVIEGIRAAVALHKYPVVLGKVVYKQNYQDISAFLELALSLGVDSVNFVNLLPHKDALTEAEEKEFWSQVITQEDKQVLQAIEGYKELPGADLVRVWPVPISADVSRCPHVCRSPWQSIGVDARGHYSPCRRIMPPAERFGHVDNAGLWQGKAYQVMRQSVLGEGTQARLCEKCFANWRDY